MKTVRRCMRVFAIATVATMGFVSPARAQGGPGGTRYVPGTPTVERPNLLRDVRFEQKLNAQVPGDLVFRDESGRAVTLNDYYGRRPIVLALVYYECPMLCSQVMSGLASALDILQFNAGNEFDVVVVSFNPREGPGLASDAKNTFLSRYRRPGAATGVHFLTGPDASIMQVTEAIGFHYKWDPDIKQYAHAAGIVVLTPEGRVSRYHFGIEYSPRDLRLAMIEASRHKIGTAVDQLLLYCYHYDPVSGRYGFAVMAAVRLAGGATVLGLASFWVVMHRREQRLARPVEARPTRV